MGALMHTPGMLRRILAFVIDSWIAGLFFAPVWIQLLASMLQFGQLEVDLSWVLICFLMQFAYSWLFLYFLGGTLGKLLLGLRVVPRSSPTDPLGLFQSFLRVLTDQLSLFFGQSLRALALIRLDRTHVSDWVAETRVIQLKPSGFHARRHVILALLVALVSLVTQFQEAYRLVQSVELTEGRFVLLESETEF